MSDVIPLHGLIARPASGREPQSMVVLLHGYGSNGADLMGLAPYWQGALPDTVFLAPDAPQPCPGAPGGYQWWSLTDLKPESRAAGARQAAPTLDAFLDGQLAGHGLTADRLALVGFSQGTMLALHVGPRRPRRLAGIVGYSGMLADPAAPPEEIRSKPPVLLIHGDADPMVPIAAFHQADTVLRGQGFDLETHVSRGLGHSIDEVGLKLGGEFLVRALAHAEGGRG